MKKLLVLGSTMLVAAGANAVVVVYDNTTTSTGTVVLNGGATVAATGTRLLADDLTLDPAAVGGTLAGVFWHVYNNNPTATTARFRLRLYNDNAGTMGTNFAAITFNAFSIASGNTGFIGADLSSFNLVVSQQKIWASIVFDANFTGSTTTVAELNNLGMGTFDPPTVGSSTDTIAVGNVAGVQGSNPNVTYGNLASNPIANIGWQINVNPVPEPGTFVAIGSGLALLAARRRRK